MTLLILALVASLAAERTVIYDIELNSAAHYPPRGVVELGSAIERAGFRAFWKGEANSPDPFVVLTGLARETSTLELGSAIVHIHARSPVSLGVAAATLQEVSGGRLLLGVGVANQTIASWHDKQMGPPLGSVRCVSRQTERVAAGERLEGKRSFALAWKPEYPKLTTFLAALGPKMSRLAGEIADGAIVNMATPQKLADIVRHVREGASAAGRDPGSLQIAAKVRVSLHPDRERAAGLGCVS